MPVAGTGEAGPVMTARDHVRFGNRRLARSRAAIDAAPAPPLGEMLQLARERKGVDLYRAERDTKIRLRYLAALEDGDYAELPAAVYTRGFLRNYALYLGLDPEEALQRYRDELYGQRVSETVSVAPPPRPLAAPRRTPTISAGMVMAGLVMLAFVAFVAYFGMQVLRYAETTPVRLIFPSSLVSQTEGDAITLTGRSGPGAMVTIEAPGGQLITTSADELGNWSREVSLAIGRNDFRIVATDPVTRRASNPLSVIITVPLPVTSPGASAAPQAPAELQLAISGPSEGSSSPDGQLVVNGSTTGTRITITALHLGPDGAPLPSLPAPTSPPASPGGPPGSPGPTAPSVDLTVGPGGVFSETLALEPGRWQITVSAYASGVQPKSLQRSITVSTPTEIVLVISAARGDSWLRIVTDGNQLRGWGGPILAAGGNVTVAAESEIWLRAGNSGVLDITLNGQELGRLGRGGEVSNWLILPGAEPVRTTETR